ncbi:[pyruvate dehydrogenase (acetyl-transferring)]-phosphatase [Salvia divinorum]|uniref:protein-serine/threonine phosphatase n=1 Tax=Salvia divinorum TaxID=28513 RepID=A0ABD1GZ61_SALDI
MVKICWKPCVERAGSESRGDLVGRANRLWWYKDLGQHVSGEFSMAVIQANNLLEDQSQLESGPLSLLDFGPCGTFVGVYDGHGGPETSRFVNQSLFPNLKRFASDSREVCADVIRKAFLATEEEFLCLVREQWSTNPQIASVGTCCLVGVICNGLLHVANAGDSRAVLEETLHPDDPQIVVSKHKVWRVKGIIQVSRSIGDAYLKRSEFNREPLLAKFRLPRSLSKPVLSAELSILVHRLNPEDRFLIFTSDGLWEHPSNQGAVDNVTSNPRNGIVRRLVEGALRRAAKKREMRYTDLKKFERGVRRHFHDDITVVVFIDRQPSNTTSTPMFSTRGGAC